MKNTQYTHDNKFRVLTENCSVATLYKEIISGKRTRFPSGIWKTKYNKSYAQECVRYLIEEVLKWDLLTLLEKSSISTFTKNYLNGMLIEVYDNHFMYALKEAYKDNIQLWEFKKIPKLYWENDENVTDMILNIFTKKYKYNRNFITKTLNREFLLAYGVITCQSLKEPLFYYIDKAFPNEFQPWEFSKVPKDFWTENTVIKALKWLYTERYPYDISFIYHTFSNDFINKHGLASVRFKFDIISLLLKAFPELHACELLRVPSRYWNDKQHVITEIKYLLEEKYNLKQKDIYVRFNACFLRKNRLRLLAEKYPNTFDILQLVYPNQFDYNIWKNYQIYNTPVLKGLGN